LVIKVRQNRLVITRVKFQADEASGQKRVSDFANLAYDELSDVWQNLQIEWPNYLIHYINY